MLVLSLRDNASAALAAMPERVQAALVDKANALAVELEAKVQQKLAGGVLNPRTGALARSIVSMVEETATGVAVTVASNGDVKYAAIHEFGGTIPPHQIVPDKARALAFAVGGKQIFAKRVNLPAVTMPERSYLRSSLAEMVGEIIGALADAVVGTVR
ncbi:MAG TPA: HK97 gp10 family phage protein [Xanthobacteraceae bacterium]|nr:HK97 gp10 family phage protein [Xanthobacteraceae bacterium]